MQGQREEEVKKISKIKRKDDVGRKGEERK
jgi:hypothetical protein